MNNILPPSIHFCDDQRVVNRFRQLKRQGVAFGIYTDRFIPVQRLELDGNRLTYDNGHGRKSVSSLIKDRKGLQTARWMNHLKYLNTNGNPVSLKSNIGNFYS
jgi:hypothetical protein